MIRDVKTVLFRFQSWARLMGMKRIWRGREPNPQQIAEEAAGGFDGPTTVRLGLSFFFIILISLF